MMTPAQSRMARAALGWTTTELAKAAKVGISTVNRFETDQAAPIPATLSAIQRALEDAGIVFLGDSETTDGGPGVRLKKGETT